jgi:hypothetical protein
MFNAFFSQGNKRILEVGTGFGALTISLSKVLSKDGLLVSVEMSDQVHKLAKENLTKWRKFCRGGKILDSKVELRVCDVTDEYTLKAAVTASVEETPHSHHDDSTFLAASMFDSVVIDIPKPHLAILNVLPLLKLGGSVGVVTRSLDAILLLEEYIHAQRMPLWQDSVIELSDRSWAVHPGLDLVDAEAACSSLQSHHGIARAQIGEDMGESYFSSVVRPQRSLWHSKSSHPGYFQIWIVKMIKVGNYDFVKSMVDCKLNHL